MMRLICWLRGGHKLEPRTPDFSLFIRGYEARYCPRCNSCWLDRP